jgi:cysteine-rich repeat protein
MTPASAPPTSTPSTLPHTGDGRVVFPERCHDAGLTAGDGCSTTCKVEIGFKCEGSPSACVATVCGDPSMEGAGTCDDGNTLDGDGCSSSCRQEASYGCA